MNTPTPWQLRVDDDHWSDKDDVELWGNPTGENGGMRRLCSFWHTYAPAVDNAKFVLRAVNSHEALMTELEHLVRLLAGVESGELSVPGLATLNGARAALKLAKGEA